MPSTGTIRSVVKSDADLKPLFEAYCRGSGQGLTWRQQHILPTEMLARHTRDPALVERVAKFYRGKLDSMPASLPRFASDFDRWRAECEASPGAPINIFDKLRAEKAAARASA